MYKPQCSGGCDLVPSHQTSLDLERDALPSTLGSPCYTIHPTNSTIGFVDSSASQFGAASNTSTLLPDDLSLVDKGDVVYSSDLDFSEMDSNLLALNDSQFLIMARSISWPRSPTLGEEYRTTTPNSVQTAPILQSLSPRADSEASFCTSSAQDNPHSPNIGSSVSVQSGNGEPHDTLPHNLDCFDQVNIPPKFQYVFDAEFRVASLKTNREVSSMGKPGWKSLSTSLQGGKGPIRGSAEYLCTYPGVSWNTRMQSWLVYYEDMTGRKSKTFNPKRFSADMIKHNNLLFHKLKNLDVGANIDNKKKLCVLQSLRIAMHCACTFAAEVRYRAKLFKTYGFKITRAKSNNNLNLLQRFQLGRYNLYTGTRRRFGGARSVRTQSVAFKGNGSKATRLDERYTKNRGIEKIKPEGPPLFASYFSSESNSSYRQNSGSLSPIQFSDAMGQPPYSHSTGPSSPNTLPQCHLNSFMALQSSIIEPLQSQGDYQRQFFDTQFLQGMPNEGASNPTSWQICKNDSVISSLTSVSPVNTSSGDSLSLQSRHINEMVNLPAPHNCVKQPTISSSFITSDNFQGGFGITDGRSLLNSPIISAKNEFASCSLPIRSPFKAYRRPVDSSIVHPNLRYMDGQPLDVQYQI